jgi:hypothetical protein
LFTALATGCRVTGVDIHEAGVAAANDGARERGLAERARSSVRMHAGGSRSTTARSTR